MNALVPGRSDQHVDISGTLSLGKVLCESGFFADARGAAQAVVKVLAGRELGISAIAAMTGINVIKGRIALSANLMAAVIKKSGRYDYRVRKHTDVECQIDFSEKGEVIGTSVFTIDDARRAGLTGDNWKKFPKNMLFARALSNGARWYCPDLFGGGPPYTPDELDPGIKIDVETDTPMLPAPTDELVAQEALADDSDLHARVAALIEETSTDLAKFLTHYQVPEITSLTPSQCAEAITILHVRKNPNHCSQHV